MSKPLLYTVTAYREFSANHLATRKLLDTASKTVSIKTTITKTT